MRWALLVVMLSGGCLESSVILCDDGRTCGAGTTCDTTHHLCVAKQALTACDGIADGMSCTFADHAGMCSAGVCLEVFCGDGVKLGGEECDGADMGAVVDCTGVGFYDPGAPGDVFCTPGCTINRDKCKRKCGDGEVDEIRPGVFEQCDTTIDTDDCTDLGYYRSGPVTCSASCVPDVSQCQDKGYCGDGNLDPEESCDGSSQVAADKTPLETCIDGGYDAGRMGCTKFCTPDYGDCKRIGWHNIIAGAQDSYNDIFVTDASNYLLGTGNGFTKVVNKVGQSVLFSGQQKGINAMWGSATDLWVAGYLGYVGHYDGTSITEKVAPSAVDADTLYGLWGTSNSNLYAAGNYRILHNTGGATWPVELNDGTTYYRSIWGTPNGSDVYAVGSDTQSLAYRIMHKTTGWASESLPVTSGVTKYSFGVSGVGSTPIIVGAPGLIARSTGNGTWVQETYDVPAAAGLTKLWVRGGANDMFVVGSQGEIGYYDGTWWRLYTGILYDVTGIHGVGNDVLAISGDKVFKHANVSWSQPIPSSGQSIVAVSTTAADKTYVLSRDRLQVKTSGRFEGGVGPDAVAGAPQFSNSIIASNMWVSGSSIAITSNENTGRGLPISSRVYRFNGTSWTTDTFPDAANGSDLTAIAGSSTLLFVGGADGAIRRFNGSWAVEATAASGHRVNAIWSDAAGIAYAVGYGPGGVAGPAGEVRRRDSTGTWTSMALPSGAQSLEAVWGSSANDVWAVGGVGPNNIYHWDGTTWTRFRAPTPYDLKGVAGTGPNDVFAVGSANVIHWDGISWTELKIPQPLVGGYEHVSARAGLVLISGSVLFALVRTGPW